MKNFILSILLLASTAVQGQQWGYVNTLTDEYLREIWTQGLDTVYIVGDNGLIARSTDRGETWEKQYFQTQVYLNDIFFINHYIGLAVGDQGTVLKTTDAGETWVQIASGTTQNINAIAATGLNNIWAVGDNSLILHSTDAGETWTQTNVLSENNRLLSDIAFRGNLGYFTGNYATVYKTEDYGLTWNKETSVNWSESYYTNAYSINIMENNTYIMVNDSLYSTKDNINWMPVFNHTLGIISNSNPFFLNDSVGYASYAALFTGNSGSLFVWETTTGGEYWENIGEQLECCSRNISYYPSKIRMVNDTLGYAIFTQVLLKMPVSNTPTTVGRIKDNANVAISQSSKGDLTVKSESNSIQSIEIFDILESV